MTASAPIRPPSGAHHGIDDRPLVVGIGWGMQKNSTIRKATIGRNDTVLASHGFSSDFRNAPFIGGPHTCSAPATRIKG